MSGIAFYLGDGQLSSRYLPFGHLPPILSPGQLLSLYLVITL